MLMSATLIQAQITINYSDESVNLNQEVVVDVMVTGFDSVQSFQMVTGWDTSRLEFVQTENVNSNFPVGYLAFSPPAVTGKKGRLGLVASTSDNVYYTISPTQPIFSIRLRAITPTPACTQVDTLDESASFRGNWFFVTSQNTRVTAGGSPGEIDIEEGCGGSTGDITISVPTGLESQDDVEICIPVHGEDLDDLGSFQGLIVVYDDEILEYKRVDQSLAPFGQATVFETSGGLNIQFLYSDNNGKGVSGDLDLFLLCFDVIGECDDETNILLQKDNFLVFKSTGAEVNANLENGSYKVNCNPCSPSLGVVHETCPESNDGIISVNLDGGCEAASFEWTNGVSTTSEATGLTPGDYSVTITYGSPSNFIILSETVDPADPVILESSDITKVQNGGDGAIDIEVSGGVSPYSYLWDNGKVTQDISGLDAGSYSVTVTDDNDCEFVFGPFLVGSAPQITDCVATGVSCFGDQDGTIDISVTGGVEPLSYNWSCDGTVDANGDISEVGAGNCTVTVTDASGAMVTKTVEVPGPAKAITVDAADIVNDDNSNGGGSIELTVSGGWGDYTYLWSNSETSNPIENLFGGAYLVTITDAAGCEAVFGPYQVEGLRIEGVVTGISCFGDNNGLIDLTITSGSGNYSCEWTCAGTVVDCDLTEISTAGTCTVTVTDLDNNRTATASFDVPGPESAITSVISKECSDRDASNGSACVEVTGGQGPYSYRWSTTPTQTTSCIENLSPGMYMVVVTDELGCEHIQQVDITLCGAEGDCFTAMDVITPNNDGSNDYFVIACSESVDNRLRIFTRRGQEVREYENYMNSWNGLDEGGNLVDEDTYLWVLEVNYPNGITNIYKGAVSVLYELR
jgi:gliding motility-associated-like protein